MEPVPVWFAQGGLIYRDRGLDNESIYGVDALPWKDVWGSVLRQVVACLDANGLEQGGVEVLYDGGDLAGLSF